MHIKQIKYKGWLLSTFFVVAFLSLPLWILVVKFFGAQSEVWSHLLKTVVADYTFNTIVLVIGVGLLTLLLGISTAWFISVFDFPGKKIFSWALVLPLSIPAYVAAYTYAGMVDYTSPVSIYTSEMLGIENAYADIMSINNLVWILGFVMYPYIYLLARASFTQQAGNVLEASRMLGRSYIRTFFSIALPLARPAVAVGITIVVMELLNDYGAMKYFGVNTFTTAICQVWFAFNDINAAIKLSGFLVIISLLFIALERWTRGKQKFYNTGHKSISFFPRKLKGIRAGAVFFICFVPLVTGFIIPFFQLSLWAIQTHTSLLTPHSWELIKNSFLLATLASGIAIVFALLIVYTCRLSKIPVLRLLMQLVNTGYAIPGAVIAIGVMVPFIFIHNSLADSLGRSYDIQTGMFVGGVIALVFAYVVRFMALAAAPIDAGFEKMNKTMDEAPRTLGASPVRSFFKIGAPLAKTSILAAGIFVFINVLKEIPLTIILRPFNFDTLATKSFEMAKNEQVAESAGLSLLIVVVSIVPVLLLNKLFDPRQK